MGEVADLAARRWGGNTDPAAHAPAEALRACLRDIEAGRIDAAHLVVAVAIRRPGNRGVSAGYYQAGDYNLHGQLGLLADVADVIGG